MAIYPIHCPVAANSVMTTLQMGAFDQQAQNALNQFSNQHGAFTGPIITSTWAIPPGGTASADLTAFLHSLRRLHDEAASLVTRCRDIDNRLQQAKQQREKAQRTTPSTPSMPAAAGARRSSTLPSFSLGYERRKLEEIELDEARLNDLKSLRVFRLPWSPGSSTGRSRWHLSFLPPDQGSLFVNEDGRAIHIRHVAPHSAVLGYGWFHSAMHYVEFDDSQKPEQKQGRSLALFTRDEVHRIEFSARWFDELIRSLRDFYSRLGGGADGKLVIHSQDVRQQPLTSQGSWSNPVALAQIFRTLIFSAPFKIETEKTLLGFRDKDLSAVEAPIPLAEIRFEPGPSEGQIVRSFYRAQTTSLGEQDLSEEVRKRLRFTATSRSPSRP